MRETPQNGHTGEVIFKSVFGQDWEALPPVMKKHYFHRAFSRDRLSVAGKMDIQTSIAAKIFSPFMRLFGALAPFDARDIPVTVHMTSAPDSRDYHFHRIFERPGKKPYHFRSRMVQIKGNDIVEFMRFGLGWRMNYLWRDGKVVLQSRGFVWRIFGKLVPLPLGLLLGTGYAEEEATGENSFRMYMDLTHPLWGKVYIYKGEFEITKQEEKS